MDEWQDSKIRNGLLWYIGKATMNHSAWRYTLLDAIHPEVTERVHLDPEELPLVSSYISPTSWYLLTTRRILGEYRSHRVEESPLDVTEDGFNNFKGYGNKVTETWTLAGKDSQQQLEFETSFAAMAPIYYMRFWRIKYPILDKLRV